MNENARRLWREGFAPQLSGPGLLALKAALERDDARLVQGCTTAPPPLQCLLESPVEGACPVGFAAWQGEGLGTVGEVEEVFARVCYAVDQHFRQPTACRW